MATSHLAGLPIAGTYTIVANKAGFAETKLENLALAGGTTAEVDLQIERRGRADAGDRHWRGRRSPHGFAAAGRYVSTRTRSKRRRCSTAASPICPCSTPPTGQAINQGDVFMNEDLFTTNGAGRRQTWFEVDGGTDNDSWGRQTMFTNIPVAAVQEMSVLEQRVLRRIRRQHRQRGQHHHQVGRQSIAWRRVGTVAPVRHRSGALRIHRRQCRQRQRCRQRHAGPIRAVALRRHRLEDAFLRRRANSAAKTALRRSFRRSTRQFRRPLSRLARLPAPRPSASTTRTICFSAAMLDGFHDTNPNGIVGGNSLPTVDRVFHRRTYSEEVGETAVLSPTLMNNVRVQFQLASPITEFDPGDLRHAVRRCRSPTGGTFTSGTSQSALLMNRQYQVNDTLSAHVGQASGQVRRRRDRRAHRRRQQGIRRSHLRRRVHLQDLHAGACAVCESSSLPGQHRQREELHAELRQRQLHRQRHAVGAVRAGRLEGARRI